MLPLLRQNKGSLLLNLLIGFGIMALIATISIPYLKKYQPNLKLDAAARNLTSDLRYAQQLTITQQVVHKVVLDSFDRSYEIVRVDTSTSTVKTVSLDPEVSFSQITGLSGDQVIFNAFGGVSESGQIILTNTQGSTATINVKPSGYIELAL